MVKWPRLWARLFRWALPVYWILLFGATHYPKMPGLGAIPQSDKVMHFVCFGLLAFLFWKHAESRGWQVGARFVWIALVILVAYAALDEYLQQFVNRCTSLIDWIADAVGIAIVLAVLELRRRRRASLTQANPQRPES